MMSDRHFHCVYFQFDDSNEPKSKEHKEKLSIARNNVGYLNVSRHYSDKYKKGYTLEI